MLEKLPEAVGHALRERRAGLDQIAFNLVDLRGGTAAIEVRSVAFPDHGRLLPNYTADGEGVSPPLQWTGVPKNTADSNDSMPRMKLSRKAEVVTGSIRPKVMRQKVCQRVAPDMRLDFSSEGSMARKASKASGE